ncbi:MAG: GNAT family N-acetyltransferase, partial [Flavisolibacter sp.]
MKELFQSAYGMDIDEAQFYKKYNTSPLGHPVIGFIAVHIVTNSPAAYYGVFPVKVLINGKEVLAAQSGDTMTHKAHQKKGLFVHLAKLTFEECSKKGIEIVFGLPNKNSYHGFTQKLNWQQIDEVIRYDLKSTVRRLPFLKIFRKLNWNKLHNRFVHSILRDYIVHVDKDFTNSLSTELGKIKRDKFYLDYKAEEYKYFIQLDNV